MQPEPSKSSLSTKTFAGIYALILVAALGSMWFVHDQYGKEQPSKGSANAPKSFFDQVSLNAKLLLKPGSSPEEQIRYYTDYIRAYPANPDGYERRGMAYMTSKLWPEAESDFSQAVKLDKKNWFALRQRAIARKALHEFEAALKDFHLSNIDVETGRTHINWEKVFKKDGDRSLVCFHNTRSYWSTAYSPKTNSLYVPYHDSCLDMTANEKNKQGWGPRRAVMRPGSDPKKYLQIAKINLSTGKIDNIYSQPQPGNGSILATAGDLLFWGDMNRRFRAFDAESGKVLWEIVLGGMVQTSTIAYSVNGKQYVAVFTGDGQSGTAGPIALAKLKAVRGHNAIYVFALPDR